MSDEYQSIPVAAARAAVQASGELVGFQGPEFWQGIKAREFGSPWLPMFAPSDDRQWPEFARVIIKRKGQDPREVVISWDEYAAELEIDDPEWLAKRTQKPMSIFGAEVERHAYRVTFADVLAPLLAPARVAANADGAMPWAATQTPVTRGEKPARDWIAEVKAADAQTLNALYDEARAAGALAKVDGLQAAIMDRTLDLEHPPVKLPPPPVTPGQIAGTRWAGENLPPRPQGQRRRRGKPRS